MTEAAANYDQKKINEFQTRYNAAMLYAQQNNLPIVVIEAAVRDTIGMIDGRRLLMGMKANGAKL